LFSFIWWQQIEAVGKWWHYNELIWRNHCKMLTLWVSLYYSGLWHVIFLWSKVLINLTALASVTPQNELSAKKSTKKMARTRENKGLQISLMV
jgi:hypothetical protein